MEDLFKNSFAKEKNDLILKIASLKEQIKIKEDFIDKNNLKVSELEEKISRNKEKILTKDKEINLLKISKVASEEFKEQTMRIQTLEKEVFKKNTEVRELLNQLELKNERINNLKEEASFIFICSFNYKKWKLQIIRKQNKILIKM